MTHERLFSARYRGLLLAAAGMTWALVTMGGVVCTTGSGMGCAGWPACQGAVVPPLQVHAVIEYTHRLLAVTTFPVVLVAAVLAWRRHRGVPWLARPLAVVVVLFVAVATFGAMVVLRGLPAWAAALDVGSALAALALLITVAAIASVRGGDEGESRRLSAAGPGAPLTGLSLATLGLVFALLVTGVLVAAPGSVARCLGWPLYGGGVLTADLAGWGGPARHVLGVLAGLAVLAVAVRAVRDREHRPHVRRAGAGLGVALAAEVSVAAALPLLGFPASLRVVYVAITVTVWGLLVLVTVRERVASRPARGLERVAGGETPA